MRWIEQRTNHSCGVIAILNILKWLGEDITYKKDYPIWNAKLRSSKLRGITNPEMHYALCKIKRCAVSEVPYITMGVIEETLNAGEIVCLSSEDHFSLITDMKNDRLFVVNNAGHHWRRKSTVKNILLKRGKTKYDIYPIGFRIEK